MDEVLRLIGHVMRDIVKSTEGGDYSRKINPSDYRKWFKLMRKMYQDSGVAGKNKLIKLSISNIPHLSIIAYVVLLENNIVVEKVDD